MVALAARPPLWVAAVLVGAFAIFHGYAHGKELPDGANAVAFSAGFVIATGLLHLTGIAFGLLTRWPAGRLAVRGAGGVIALVGLAYLGRLAMTRLHRRSGAVLHPDPSARRRGARPAGGTACAAVSCPGTGDARRSDLRPARSRSRSPSAKRRPRSCCWSLSAIVAGLVVVDWPCAVLDRRAARVRDRRGHCRSTRRRTRSRSRPPSWRSLERLRRCGASTLALVAAIAMHATRPWQRIGVRIVGSWIAASAILVLALRLAR